MNTITFIWKLLEIFYEVLCFIFIKYIQLFLFANYVKKFRQFWRNILNKSFWKGIVFEIKSAYKNKIDARSLNLHIVPLIFL